MDKELEKVLQGTPLTQTVTCRCSASATIPILWEDYYCATCGHHTILEANPARTLARKLISALGTHPERLGLAVGDPQTLPNAFVSQLRAEVGRNFAFVKLSGKFKFECTHCGKCCKHPITSKKSYFANLSVEESQRIFGDTHHEKLPLNEDRTACMFWDATTLGCKIHEKRPTFCRLFPLQSIGLDIEGQRVRFLAWIPSPCPGVGKGKLWTVHEFLKVSGVLHRFVRTG